MEASSIGIVHLGKQSSIQSIYLWNIFPQVWYPLGKIFPYGDYAYGRRAHTLSVPWEIGFHTADILMERFSTGWLTFGKGYSIGWLYLWKRNSIRAVYLWKGIPYGYYTYDSVNSLRSIPMETLSVG